MFAANSELQVSNMDFKSIKNNLKNFISNKTEFYDYDFEGSTMSYLLDILAYNTYMNSFYTNMAINETYLDTAQIRANVVSNAKKLGYTPTSAKSAVAKIDLLFAPDDSPSQIKIPKGSKFVTSKDGKNYEFITIQDYSFTASGSTYQKTIDIYQGVILTQTYVFSTTQNFYPILAKNVDVSTLVVSVKPNANSTDITYLTAVSSIADIKPTDDVYFIQENSDEQFELYFGNNVLGKALENGNVITIEYVVCDGSEGNNLSSFKNVGYTGYNLLTPTKKYLPTRITTIERSSKGTEKESIESIRFNAPNSYFAQNRLVTVKDFENFIHNNFSFVQSINVWGGEDHWTPLYGKVIISIKPYNGYALTTITKDELVSAMSSKTVLTIEPLIIDPIFTFIKPEIRVTYDASKTIKTYDEIYNDVQLQVQEYEENYLANFGKSFRYSTFVRIIDSTDKSIISNETEIQLEKRFVPIFGSTITYELNFGAEIKHPYDGYLGAISSDGFYVVQTDQMLYLEDDGYGKIRSFYTSNSNQKIIFNENIGTVDYTTGIIKLNSMYFTQLSTGESELKIYVHPQNKDYTQVRNQIVLISNPRLFIIDSKTKQITKSGILDVQGNISPILSTSITGSLVTL